MCCKSIVACAVPIFPDLSHLPNQGSHRVTGSLRLLCWSHYAALFIFGGNSFASHRLAFAPNIRAESLSPLRTAEYGSLELQEHMPKSWLSCWASPFNISTYKQRQLWVEASTLARQLTNTKPLHIGHRSSHQRLGALGANNKNGLMLDIDKTELRIAQLIACNGDFCKLSPGTMFTIDQRAFVLVYA